MDNDFPYVWRGIFVVFGVLVILAALLVPVRKTTRSLDDEAGGLSIGDAPSRHVLIQAPDGEIRIYHRNALIYTIPAAGKDEGER